MKLKNTNVRATVRIILITAFLSLCSAAFAAETGMVREVYACNYTSGSDLDDLMGARDFYIKQMAKAGITPSDAFVWTPIAGTPDIDFIWFNNNENLNAFGQGYDQYAASAEGQAADARFDSVSTCEMSLAARQPIYEGEDFGNPGNVIIGSSACTLNHGQTMENVQDLVSHLRGVLSESELHKSFLAYLAVPTVSTADVDLYMYGVHHNMAEYAARTTEIQTSEDWGMLRRHFQQVLECKTSLWNGMRVVPAS